MFQSGLVSISFRSLSPEQIVALCRDAGLSAIEWGSDVHAPYADTERLRHIVALQKESGISCSSYGTYFKLGVHDTDELHGYIAAAKILGTHILRLWCGDKNYEDMTAEQKDHLLTEAKKAAQIAEAESVVLCMECHNNTFTNCLKGALTLMEAVNSPALRMYWQPNQFRTDEVNFAYAKAIAPYTENIHVFQWKEKEKFPLADGMAIWEKYLSCFDGSQALLLEFMPDNKPESLKKEAETLHKLMEGANRK